MPQPSVSGLHQGIQYHAPAHEVDVSTSLAAFLAFSVDRVFCHSTGLPSALISEPDILQPNAVFVAALCKHAASTLKLLWAFLRGQDGPFQPSFLSSFAGLVSSQNEEGTMTNSTSDQMSVLSHILSSPVWEVLMDQLPGEMGAAGDNVVRLITISLYQAVAIVEKGLLSSSSSAAGSEGGAMDSTTLQQCRADIKEALLICTAPKQDVCAPTSHPAAPSQPASSTANVSSSVLPHLRSSLVHLREAVKSSHRNNPFVPKPWELIKAELLLGEEEDVWGVSSCCNLACARLEGPCELEAKTLSCGGSCGARYCSRDCQVQAWRAGHTSICASMKEIKESDQQRRYVEGISPTQVFIIISRYPLSAGLRIQHPVPS